MMEGESDKSILFHFFERYYDPEESYSHLEHQVQMAITSSTLSIEKVFEEKICIFKTDKNWKKKEKEKKNQKEKEKERELVLMKNKRLCLLVEAEILFEEYCDSLTYFFLKKVNYFFIILFFDHNFFFSERSPTQK